MSSSSTTPQSHTSVSLLSDVFAGENEDTKQSLCAEVGRLADTELDSLILKLTRKLIANQGSIINSQSSSSSSLSAAAAPKCHLNVDKLRQLLEEEKEATKVAFRGDLHRCVELVVGSLFKRLTNKSMHLELAQLDSVNGGECAPVVNQTESSSNAHVASLTQPPTLFSSTSGGSVRFESVPLPPVCNCPNPHPHVKPIVLHREVKQEVKEENEDDAKDMIISGTDINNQLVEAETLQNASNSNESIEEGGASNLSGDQHNTTTLNVPNEVTTVTQSAHLFSPSTSSGLGSNRTALNQQATVPTSRNGNKRKQPSSNLSAKRSKQTIEDGNDGDDGEDIANEDREDVKVKVLNLNCTESNCNDKLDSLAHLYNHLSTVHQLSPLRCFATNCNARFDNGIQIRAHIQQHHSSDTRFLCTICSKDYDSQNNAYFHWYQNHQTGQFECNFVSDCAQVSDTRVKMSTHQLVKHQYQLKHLHCTHPGCTSSFAFKAHLKRHESTHLDRKPFHCMWLQCSYRTNLRAHLVKHIRTQHFGLPGTMKAQKEKNIVDLRDPNEYVRVVVDE